MTWQAIVTIYIVIGCGVVVWADWEYGPPPPRSRRLIAYVAVVFLYPIFLAKVLWEIHREGGWRR